MRESNLVIFSEALIPQGEHVEHARAAEVEGGDLVPRHHLH